MAEPVRVQLSRKKGWRMPENTVSVARPGKWGNRWTVAGYREAGFRPDDGVAIETCINAFKAWMIGEKHWAHGYNETTPPDVTELRGKNLACWCPLDQPCHADVLLELANAKDSSDADTLPDLAQQIKARRARQLLADEMTSLKQRQHIEGDGSAAYATVTGPQALRAIEAALSEAERMREAGQAVIAQAFDHYTARNGRRIGIEGDDGEKCWIVPFDAFEELRAALEPKPEARAAIGGE